MTTESGDRPLAELLERLGRLAFPVAVQFSKRSNTTPEDLIQEAFLIVTEDPTRLDREFPENSFRKIVRNVGMNAVKRHAHRLKPVDPGAAADHARSGVTLPSDAPDAPDRREVANVVHQEISLLPPAQQQALLSQLAGNTLSEASIQHGRSEQSLAKEGTRGKQRLQRSGRLRRLSEYLALAPWLRPFRENPKAGMLASACVIAVAVGLLGVATIETGEVSVAEGSAVSGPNGALSSTGDTSRNNPSNPSAGAEGDSSGSKLAGSGGGPQMRPSHSDGATGEEYIGLPVGPVAPPLNKHEKVEDVPGRPGMKLHTIRHPSTGVLLQEWTTLNGKRHGTSAWYRDDQTLRQTLEYQHGAKHGTSHEFDVDGTTLTRYIIWEHDKDVKWVNVRIPRFYVESARQRALEGLEDPKPDTNEEPVPNPEPEPKGDRE
jgi:DNA-directed RNA polymerase specialized sigma24 family protein